MCSLPSQCGNRALLSAAQIAVVKDKLHRYRPVDVLGQDEVVSANGLHWTVPDLKRALQQWYGVVYRQEKSYHELFERCDFSYQRVARLYRLCTTTKVAEFEEQLEKN